MIAWLLVGCSAYLLEFGEGPREFDSGDRPDDTDSAPPPPVEECNGVDDDDDGFVDEGFPDGDGDGLADCVDPPCADLAAAPPGELVTDPACGGDYLLDPPVSGPLTLAETWRIELAVSEPSFGATPLVAYLDDDDGDGHIGPGDGLEALVGSWSGDLMYVVDVVSGTVKRRLTTGTSYYQTPALADADGDGRPEIYATRATGRPVSFTADGAFRWEAAENITGYEAPYVTVADLEGDGKIEVLVADLVLDARTGRIEARLPVGVAPYSWYDTVAADLDLDGTAEILAGCGVFEPDGTARWVADLPSSTSTVWNLPVQADDDEEGEVACVGRGLYVFDTDGAALAATAFPPDATPGPPAAADLDGDGRTELAIPLSDALGVVAFELDGSPRWLGPSGVWSWGPGATAADLHGDGAYEVLYDGPDALYVLDGATGEILDELDLGDRLSAWEVPVVADLDGDGHADILAAASTTAGSTLVALHGAEDDFAPTGDRWTQHAFVPSPFDATGTVSGDADPPWLCPGVWRAWPARDVSCGRPDLIVTITDLCEADCAAGGGVLAFQVGNAGTRVAHDVTVALFAQFGSARLPLGVVVLGDAPAGALLAGELAELPAAAAGATGFTAEVREGDGGREECHPGDEVATLDSTCR